MTTATIESISSDVAIEYRDLVLKIGAGEAEPQRDELSRLLVLVGISLRQFFDHAAIARERHRASIVVPKECQERDRQAAELKAKEPPVLERIAGCNARIEALQRQIAEVEAERAPHEAELADLRGQQGSLKATNSAAKIEARRRLQETALDVRKAMASLRQQGASHSIEIERLQDDIRKIKHPTKEEVAEYQKHAAKVFDRPLGAPPPAWHVDQKQLANMERRLAECQRDVAEATEAAERLSAKVWDWRVFSLAPLRLNPFSAIEGEPIGPPCAW